MTRSRLALEWLAAAGAIRGGRLSRRWLWQRIGKCAAFGAALALVVFGAGALQ